GVICLTPGVGYLGIDSLTDAQKYGPRPMLLVASEPEKASAEQLGRLVSDAEVKVIPGRGEPMALHGTRMFGKAPGIEKTIAQFAQRAAGKPTRDTVIASTRGQV